MSDAHAAATDASPLLALRGITRTFGDVVALRDVDFAVQPGHVHALLGENGAGKTTLMRIALGMLAPDRGTVVLDGTSRAFRSPADALAAGLGMVHQHFSLVPAMTVAENVSLGGHGRFSPRDAAARVRAIGERTGLVLDPAARVGDLPVGAQQRCEIVKALARDARVLILDEPTAVLAPEEARELLAWVRRFADGGGAVVLITHKLRDALAIGDEVTVLRFGERVLHAACVETDEAALAAAMIGGAAAAEDNGPFVSEQPVAAKTAHDGDARGPSPVAAGAVVFRADALTLCDARGVVRVRDASFTVHAGELFGIAAVEGQGQHELLRALTTTLAPDPHAVAFIPEDRHRDALLLDATLTENLALRDATVQRGRLPWRALRERTQALLTRGDVRAAGPDVRARTLSGGNQQKLVVARALDVAPPAPPLVALVAENPTRGLDFAATRAVHAALREARARGLAVVLYSSDLDEVLALADRVLVLHDGAAQLLPPDRERVGRAMVGATVHVPEPS